MMLMKRATSFSALRLAGLILGGVLMACSATTSADSAPIIRFGHAYWPGVTVKTRIVTEILQDIGYRTHIIMGAQPVMLHGLQSGEIDVDMEAWRPVQNPLLDKLIKSGHVTQVVANIKAARYGLAVPDYVYKAGVRSVADLHNHPERFGRKVYGIEAGNAGNEIVKKAIKSNTYQLGEWEVVASSTTGMLAQVGKAVPHKDWIVFLGWAPHWMNVLYHIHYLDDPKQLFGKQSTVYTMANTRFLRQTPNIARFLKQIIVPVKAQNEWIYRYGYKNIAAKKVAHEWIENHLDTVAKWLTGVMTADGSKQAMVAVHARLD